MNKNFEQLRTKVMVDKHHLAYVKNVDDFKEFTTKKLCNQIGNYIYENIEKLPLEFKIEEHPFSNGVESYELSMCVIDKNRYKELLEMEESFYRTKPFSKKYWNSIIKRNLTYDDARHLIEEYPTGVFITRNEWDGVHFITKNFNYAILLKTGEVVLNPNEIYNRTSNDWLVVDINDKAKTTLRGMNLIV